MIDHVNNLKLQYLVELSKLGDRCAIVQSDIEQWLKDHDVVFTGSTIPFVLMPHFISLGQLKRVRRSVTILCRVLDRFCAAYANDAGLRAELALPATEDALIRLDPGYPHPLRICRLDAFLATYDVKFLEFNADSPAGIGYTDILYDGLSQNIKLPHVDAEFDTSYSPMIPRVLDTLRRAYADYRQGRPDLPDSPTLALIDVKGSPSVPEFRIICRAAEKAGMPALHATLDQLSYDGSRLTVDGVHTPLIYRRALLEDIANNSPLIQAIRDGRACVVNPFSARVANSKKIFALLQDERFRYLLENGEDSVIESTIPWTRILRPGRVNYGNWTVDLVPFAIDNRERLVLKPSSDYGGHGVLLGIQTDADLWEEMVKKQAETSDYVVQEYLPVPEEMFPTVDRGRIQMQLKYFNINPFGIGGQYAGSITRISDDAVINVSAGGGLLPSVVGRHRRRLLGERREEQ